MSADLDRRPQKVRPSGESHPVEAIETGEYDGMVAAVEHLMDKGEGRLSPEEAALLETMAILAEAYDDRHHPVPSVAPNGMLACLMESSGQTPRNYCLYLAPAEGFPRSSVASAPSAKNRPGSWQEFSKSRPISSSDAGWSGLPSPT